jgi:hypothetical protein
MSERLLATLLYDTKSLEFRARITRPSETIFLTADNLVRLLTKVKERLMSMPLPSLGVQAQPAAPTPLVDKATLTEDDFFGPERPRP